VGKGWFGAPVRESFVVKGGKARWTSLDDKGEGDAKNALYIPSNATPSVQQLYLRVLLGAKDQMHAALPGGTLRLEKLHDVEIGTAKGQGHGLRDLGLDLTPFFLLARGDRLVATLYPGWVLVEDAHVVDFEELSALAASLSLETVKTVSARLNCGFVFRKRDRLNRPSACPVCRGQHLGPPRFAVQPA
jgi:hypothetical protein